MPNTRYATPAPGEGIFELGTPINVASKADSVANKVSDKQVGLGVISPEEAELQKQMDALVAYRDQLIAQQDPEYRSDPNSLMSDADASSGVGQVVNAGGIILNAIGKLDSMALHAPEFVQDIGTRAVKDLGNVFSQIPGITEIGEAIADTDVGKQVIGGGIDRIDKILTGITEPFAKSGDAIERGTSIFANRGEQNRVVNRYREEFQESTGFFDGAQRMVEVAIDEPAVGAEIFIDSFPQMVALAKSGSAGASAFLAITGDRVAESEAIFIQTHGRPPVGEEYAAIIGTSLVATGIDKFESMFILNKLPDAVTDPVTNVLDNAVSKAGAVISKTPVGSAIAKSVAVSAKTVERIPFSHAVGKGSLTAPGETLQEASQTFLTELGGKQGKFDIADPQLQEDLFVAGGMGLSAGGFGGTAVQAVDDAKELLNGLQTKAAKAVIKSTAGLGDVEASISKAKDATEVLHLLPEKFHEADAETRVDRLGKGLDAIEELTLQLSDAPDKEAREKLEADLNTYKTLVDQLLVAHKRLIDQGNEVNPQQEIANVLDKKIEESAVEETIVRVLGSEQSDDILTEEVLEGLTKSKLFVDNASPEIKAEIQRRFEEAQLKSADDVSTDILVGSTSSTGQNFRGSAEYVSRAKLAIETNNQKQAETEVAGLTNLLQIQQAKLDRLLAAWAEFQITGKPAVAKDIGNTAEFNVSNNSAGFIEKVAKETAILRADATRIADLYNKRFDKTVAPTAPAPEETIPTKFAKDIPAHLIVEPVKEGTPPPKEKTATVEEIIETVSPEPTSAPKIKPIDKATPELLTKASNAFKALKRDSLSVQDQAVLDSKITQLDAGIKNPDVAITNKQLAAVRQTYKTLRDKSRVLPKKEKAVAAKKPVTQEKKITPTKRENLIRKFTDVALPNLRKKIVNLRKTVKGIQRERKINTKRNAFGTIQELIAAKGGVSRAVIENIDKETLSNKQMNSRGMPRGKPFTRATGGMNINEVRELLEDIGFIPPEGQELDDNFVLELIRDFVNGGEVTPLPSDADSAAEFFIQDEQLSVAENEATEELLIAEQEYALQQEYRRIGKEKGFTAAENYVIEQLTGEVTEESTVEEIEATPTEPTVKAEAQTKTETTTAPKKKTFTAIRESLSRLHDKGLTESDRKARDQLINIIDKILAKRAKDPSYFPDKHLHTTIGNRYNELLGAYAPTLNLGQRLLKNGLTNRSHTARGNKVPQKNSLDFLENTGKKINTLMHNVVDVISNITDKAVTTIFKKYDKAQLTAFKHVYVFTRQFNAIVSGTHGHKPLLNILTKKEIFEDRSSKNAESLFDSLGDLSKDTIGYLVQVRPDGTRYLDENLVSMIAMVAYDWLGTQGAGTLYNDDRAINSILGRAASTEISYDVREALSEAGTVRNNAADNIGAQVFAQLGLKARDDVSGAFEGNLKNSIGHLAITVLIQQGYLTQQKINMNALANPEGYQNTNLKFERETNFIRIENVPDPERKGMPKVSDRVAVLQDNLKKSRDIINEFISTPDFVKGPFTSVQKKLVEFLKGTQQKVPTKLLSVVEKMQKVPFQAKSNVMEVFEFFEENQQLDMGGFNFDIDGTVHEIEVENVKGKNLSIARDLKHAKEFLEEHTDNPFKKFYFRYEVWKNNRIGVISNTISLQNSKIHRHLFGAAHWETEVNPKDRNQLAQFAYAVSLAFGGKIDVNSHEQNLAHFDSIRSDDVVVKAVEAIRTIQRGDKITASRKAELQRDIVAAVKQGGESYHTLDALVALSGFSPRRPFTTNLAIETDGKTNGVIIGITQSMTDTNAEEKLAAGGIFVGNEYTEYSDWKSDPSHLDSYESLAKKWHDKIVGLFTKVNEDTNQREWADTTARGIYRFLKPMVVQGMVTEAARKLTKNPLMITNYGASIARVVEEFSNDVLTKIYTDIVAADQMKDPAKREEELKRIEDAINFMQNSAPSYDKNGKRIYDLLNRTAPFTTFRLKNEKALVQSISNTYGQALTEAIEEEFGAFEQFRTTVNNSLNVMFHVFNKRYNEAVTARETKENRVLSNEEKREEAMKLQHLMPIFRGPVSEGFKDGIIAMGDDLTTNYGDDYQIKQTYTHKIPGMNSNSVTGHSRSLTFSDGGVAGLILAIQSMDSAIIQQVLAQYQMLNMFDAGYYKLDDVESGTHDINQAYYKLNKDYAIIDAIAEAYQRVTDSVTDPKERALIDALISEEGKIKQGEGEAAVSFTLDTMFEELKQMQETVNEARESRLFSKNVAVGQYVHHNSSYVVDEHNDVEFDPDASIEQISSTLLEHYTDNSLGSDGTGIDPKDFDTLAGDPVDGANTEQIFDVLGMAGNKTDSPAHTEHLRDIISNLVSKALDPLNDLQIKVRVAGNKSVGLFKEVEVIENGKKVLKPSVLITAAGGMLTNALHLSAQEVYAHEMVHAITRWGIDNNYALRKKIEKIFLEAKKTATFEDFLQKDSQGNIVYTIDKAAEIQAAKDRYEYIFENRKRTRHEKIDPSTGHITESFTNDYLHEFVAFGLTNAQFRKKLSTVRNSPERKKLTGNLWERLEAAFYNVVNYLSDVVHKTNNLTADKALLQLVQEMTGIHERKRNTILKTLDKFQLSNNALISALNDWIHNPMTTFLNKNKGSKSRVFRAVSTAYKTPQTLASPEGHRVIETVTRNIGLTEKSFIKQLVREGIGRTVNNVAYHTLLRFSKKHIDQARKHLGDEIAEESKKAFHENLTTEDSEAVYRALMKTDAVVLLDYYSITQIMDIMSDQTKLDKAINDTNAEILRSYGKEANYYINQARGLGMVMAQGVTPAHEQMLNAHRIASMNSMPDRALTGDITKRVNHVDKLATLYALNRTTADTRQRAVDLMLREHSANEGANGITHLFDLHNNFKETAQKQLFNGPNLMMKGYTHETFNPANAIRVATATEGAELEAENWKNIGAVPKDPSDPTAEQRYMYLSTDQMTMTYVKSIASLTNTIVKGTTLADAYKAEELEGENSAAVNAILGVAQVKAEKALLVEKQFEHPNVTVGEPKPMLIPIANETGATVGYRYMMSESSKTQFLEKDARFERVLGRMYGSVVDKVNTQQINNRLIRLAHEDFQSGFATDPKGYVEVSAQSSDPELREIYNLLPKEARRDIKRIWGNQPMYVRADLVNLMFGYRKLSMTDSKPGALLGGLIVAMSGGKYNADGTVNLRATKSQAQYIHIAKSFEHLWQELIGIVKDNIVIKNGVTLAGNIMSNTVLLFVKGVPIDNLFKEQALALTALNDFMATVKEKNGLKRQLQVNKRLSSTEKKALLAAIAKLEDNIATNPVKELIDEGIFQTITEDVELDDDNIYSTKERYLKKAQPYIDKIVPENIMSGYKWGYMTHDTPAYKLLLRGTQYSDFIARFTLYHHHLKNGMGGDVAVKDMTSEQLEELRQAALGDVIETFINYDIPTSKIMQYANDMGALMFTKFLFRIQKIIFKTMKDKPANALAVYSLQEMFGELSDIPDSNLITSSLVGRLNDPFDLLDTGTEAWGLNHAMDAATSFTE